MHKPKELHDNGYNSVLKNWANDHIKCYNNLMLQQIITAPSKSKALVMEEEKNFRVKNY